MVLMSKRANGVLVELCQNGTNYYIQVNGRVKEHSTDKNYMVNLYNTKYR